MVGDRFTRRSAAQPSAIGGLRREVAAYAQALGANQAAWHAVMLAVSEALTNVAVHAYVGQEPGDVMVEAWQDEQGHFLVVICDEGLGMVPRTDSPGLGVGITLMTQMADDVRVANRHDRSGTIVSLRFSLDGSPRARRGD